MNLIEYPRIFEFIRLQLCYIYYTKNSSNLKSNHKRCTVEISAACSSRFKRAWEVLLYMCSLNIVWTKSYIFFSSGLFYFTKRCARISFNKMRLRSYYVMNISHHSLYTYIYIGYTYATNIKSCLDYLKSEATIFTAE